MKKEDWLKPGNIIAFVTLIVTAIGVWGGVNFFNNTQVIKSEGKCEGKRFEQKATDSNSSQKINCKKGVKSEIIKQE